VHEGGISGDETRLRFFTFFMWEGVPSDQLRE